MRLMTLEVRTEKGHFENSPVASLRLWLGTFAFQPTLPLNVRSSFLASLFPSAIQITCG